MIRPFAHITNADVATCGGKGASLGELAAAGVPVPGGFVLTAGSDIDEAALFDAFDALGAEYVAVRSSATKEDSVDDSFAGQFDTFLNTTRETLLENVRRCIASLSSDRMRSYLAAKYIAASAVQVAVVVQRMVDAEVAGVVFTANPVTQDRGEVMIEAGWGLGEAVVSGMITPDNYVVRKDPLTVRTTYISEQERMIVRDPVTRATVETAVPEERRAVRKLSEERVLGLAEQSIRIEAHYGRPMDIEWALDAAGTLWILQARPITTL